MDKNMPYLRLLVALVVALSMVMPAAFIVSADLDVNDETVRSTDVGITVIVDPVETVTDPVETASIRETTPIPNEHDSRAIVWSDDFEDGDFSDWTLGGGSNDWEIDTPAGLGSPADPVGAYAGNYSIGNDLTGLGSYPGEYESNLAAGSNIITSPVIDCTGSVGVELEFYRWLGVESSTFDHASIEVSNTGAWPGTIIWDHTAGSFTDPVWILQTYDISAVADGQATVYVRFNMGPTDGSVEYCGWNIDDIAVKTATPPPPTFYSEDFDPTTGWTITTTGRAWEETTDSGRYGAICGAGDNAWVCDSDLAGSGVPVDSWLISPVIDCSNREFIDLVFDHQYDYYGETASEGCFVYVANDGSVDAGDTLVFHEYTIDIALETRRINISVAADKEASVQIGFRYVANYDYWWVVDDVLLQGFIADQTAPAQVDTLVGTAGDCQVDLDWTGYDEAGQGDVMGYRVYHDLVPITDVSALTPVGTTPAGDFQHNVTELRNGVDHYFAVTAIDEVPNENPSVIDVGPLMPLPYKIVDIPLSAGWNLVSIPVIQTDTNINSVLSTIAGQLDYAMWFDNTISTWRSYATFKPASLNTLTDIDHTMAVWISVTGPCILTVGGDVPEMADIYLITGWNLVGYPSFSTSTTIADALTGLPYDMVDGYSPLPGDYYLQTLPSSYVMQNGEGYWILVTGDATWSLTNDVMAPIVDSTSPVADAIDVSVNSAIDITFSEEVDQAMAEAAFSMIPFVPGSFSWTGPVMTYTPSSPLTGGPTTYSVGIDKSACDLSANGMPWDEAFDFTTEDNTPPIVLSTDPFDGETAVPPGNDIIITFNEAMDQGFTEAAFSIVPPASGVFSWSPDGMVMTFNPDSTLNLLTTYTVTVDTGARDLAGNNLVSNYVFDFDTSADPVERHAIIIGISDYQFISDLSYCDEDATDIYYYLIALGYTCEIYGDGPAPTSSFPIYTGDADEATVRAAMQTRVAALTSNDYFIYTTSGHGDGDGSGSSYLCQWDCSGANGCYYDTEVQTDMNPCVAEKQFVFIDHCYAGGMGPELMVMPNSVNVYVGTTCTENGYGYDDGAHSNGMWTYWFWEAGFDGNFGCNPTIPMEDVWTWAATNYPYQPPSGDAPMEFDGDPGTPFTI